MTNSSASDASVLNISTDGNVHTYATTEQLKKKKFIKNSQNQKKQNNGILLIFIFEIKFKKEHFPAKYDQFFSY